MEAKDEPLLETLRTAFPRGVAEIIADYEILPYAKSVMHFPVGTKLKRIPPPSPADVDDPGRLYGCAPVDAYTWGVCGYPEEVSLLQMYPGDMFDLLEKVPELMEGAGAQGASYEEASKQVKQLQPQFCALFTARGGDSTVGRLVDCECWDFHCLIRKQYVVDGRFGKARSYLQED